MTAINLFESIEDRQHSSMNAVIINGFHSFGRKLRNQTFIFGNALNGKSY